MIAILFLACLLQIAHLLRKDSRVPVLATFLFLWLECGVAEPPPYVRCPLNFGFPSWLSQAGESYLGVFGKFTTIASPLSEILHAGNTCRILSIALYVTVPE
jgi:hypothetical protein